MQKMKGKILAISIALLLIISMSTELMLLPTTSAHDPPWQIPTTAYINVAPNPVGVGQQTIIVIWLDRTPSGALVTNDIKFHNYKVDITKPDGTTEQKTVPTVTDPTSSAYILYTP